MFKKSLLALAVAGFTVSATAGTIYSSAAAGVATDLLSGGAAGDALGAGGAVGGADDNCDVAASDLGVTLTNTGNGEGGDDDTITFNAATDFSGTTSVAMTGAGACTVNVALQTSSSTAKSPAEAPAGTVSVGAVIDPGLGGFRQEDTITINFNGAGIDLTNTTNPLLTSTGAGTFDLLDITSSAVRFTVTSGGADIGASEAVTLSNIVLDNSTINESSTVTIGYFATNTSGTQYDVTAATEIHEFVPQYSATVTTALNGVIDVQSDRQSLVSTTPESTTDEDRLTIAVALDATTNLITPVNTTIVIGGNWAWLDAAADTSDDGEPATAAEIATYLGAWYTPGTDDTVASVSLNEDLDELTVVLNAVGGGTGAVDATHQFDITVPGQADGNPVLPEQTFVASVVVDDGVAAPNTNNMTAATNLAAGSWTLNGSVVEVPYLPFGPVTQPIFRHTNTGNQSGDISLRYMVEGEHTEWQDAGVLIEDATPGVRNLLSEINGAMVAEGYDASVAGFKVALEVTTNVPQGDVALTVGAKFSNQVDTDRLSIGIIE